MGTLDMEEIRQWLNSDQDYTTGCKLYEQHGKNQVLKKLFALGASSYNQAKLEQELLALCPPMATPAPVLAPKPKPAAATDAAENQVSYQVWLEIQPLLDEQRALHTELSVLPSSTTRLKHALRIMELADQLAVLWEKYHYVKEHGQLPAILVPEVVPATEADQLRRLTNLRTYRVRYQNRPDRLPAIEAEIKNLEAAIKNGK